MNAQEFLHAAVIALAERGAQYESGDENSMAEIVQLHDLLVMGPAGEDEDAVIELLSEEQGWLFMVALKLVRLRKSLENGHPNKDSIVDLLGYIAKLGECIFQPESKQEVDCPHDKGYLAEKDGKRILVCGSCNQEVE